MKLPRLDKRTAALLQRVGNGRRLEGDAGSITLRCRDEGIATGPGVMLGALMDGQAALFWCDERQWCDWIEPMLCVPDFEAVPAELHAALAAWTLAEAGVCGGRQLAEAGVGWPAGESLATAQLSHTPAWVLHAEHHGRRLDVSVVKAPIEWIERLAAALQPTLRLAGLPRMSAPLPLIAGWAYVSKRQLDNLAVGDALQLVQSYRVDRGEAALFIDKPVARLVMRAHGEGQIEDVMENFDDWLNVAPPALTQSGVTDGPAGERGIADSDGMLSDAMLTVVAEAATYDVALADVANLSPGMILTGATKSDGRISLKMNGKLIAYGSLLDIDGRLAVRVDSFV